VTVGGSIQISDVTIQIYKSEQKKLHAIEWRGLEHVQIPNLSDSENARAVLCSDIRNALRISFGEAYKKFTVLFQVQRASVEGESVFFYIINCHQAKFASMLRQAAFERFKKILAIKSLDEVAQAEARQRYRDTIAEEEKAWKNWTLRAKIAFTSNLSALEITYDPQTLEVSIVDVENYSLNPADYRQHLSTTSELMRYLASVAKIKVGFTGNIEWAINDFRLMKVLVSVLDRDPIELDRISVNVDNYEEWDYFNPKFEEEVLALRA
jgi:hypothetical protein